MTESRLDSRAATWLDQGPTRAPDDSLAQIMAAVATVPQRRPWFRLRGRPVAVPGRLAAAMTVLVVLVAAGGAVVAREPLLDALAPAPAPGDLLYGTRTIQVLDASGEPAGEQETLVIGTLPQDEAFIVAARCTGGTAMPVEIWDRSASYGPDATDEDRQPAHRLEVTCDGSAATSRFVASPPSDTMEAVAVVPAGTAWEVAIGKVRDLPDEPAFAPPEPVAGTVLMMDSPPFLAYGRPGPGIGLQAPPAGEMVTVLVQCLGDPVTVTNDTGVPPVVLPCVDPTATTRIEMPVTSAGTAYAGTDGFAWVRMAVEAPTGSATGGRPEAPPMPAPLAAVAFAEGDGQNAVFGTLGSNRQELVRIPDSLVGEAGGDVVGISRAEGDGSVLELWSMRDAAPLRTLATIDGGRVFGSWVDATHEQVMYGVQSALGSFEWRRVGFDGGADTLIASGPIGVRFAQAAMAADDAHFVAQWCPLVGPCERAVHDTATGATRKVTAVDEVCTLLGVIAGSLVASTATSCDTAEGAAIVAQPLDGGAWTTLFDGYGDVTLLAGEDGPLAVRLQAADRSSTLSAVAIDGTGAREIATFDHESGMEPVLSRVSVPEPGWVLLAGRLGEIPGGVSIGGGGPTLLHVGTGERIELVNLPGF